MLTNVSTVNIITCPYPIPNRHICQEKRGAGCKNTDTPKTAPVTCNAHGGSLNLRGRNPTAYCFLGHKAAEKPLWRAAYTPPADREEAPQTQVIPELTSSPR